MHVHAAISLRALRPVSRLVVLAMVTAMVTVLGWGQLSAPASAAVVTIPQQGGNHSFEATPGMTVLAGYSFEYVTGASTIINSGGAVLSVTCKNGSSPSQTSLTVPMPYQEYLDPAPNSSGWSPSGDQKDASVYQGSFVIGDYCAGTTMVIGGKMGPFTADVYSDAGESLSFRWHYGPVGGPKNVVGQGSSWSATKTVVPDPLPVLGADLGITKSDAPDPVRRGQTLTYSLAVENNSAINSAQNVVVTDTLDANTSFVSSSPSSPTCTHSGQATGGTLTCQLGTLAAGATSVVSITTTVAASAPADVVPGSAASPGGPSTNCGTYDVCNRVSVTSTTTDPSMGNNSYFQPTNVIRPEIHLVKSVSDSGDADSVGSLGETLTYSFTVTNTGNVPLTNVKITDPMFSLNGAACVANLAVGASTNCPLLPTQTHTVTAADISAGSVNNTATTTGTPPAGPDVADQDSATIPTPPNPAISLDKSVSDSGDADSVGSLGETLTYSFTVTNTGNVPLTNVKITDPMFSLNGAACVANLAVGASTNCPLLPTQTHTVTAADISAGSVDNIATTTGTPPTGGDVTDTDDASMPTQTNAPAISLDKSVSDSGDADSVGSLGETLTYSFVVTNTGDVPLTNVRITDPMFSLSGAACVANLAVGASTNCPLLPTQTHTVTAADISAGSVNNTATTTATPPAGPDVSDQDSATMPTPANPSIHLVKSVSDSNDADSVGSLGETLTYSFVVTNTGNVALTNVKISDAMLGLSNASCVANLAVGASTSCPLLPTQTHTVTAADIAAGSVDNTATAKGTPPAGPDVSDQDSATIATPANPSIQLVKSVSDSGDADSVGSLGETLTYTFTVTNTGNVPLTNVKITDPMFSLSGAACVANLAVGASSNCPLLPTQTHTVTAADISAGSVNNTGTTTGTPPTGGDVTDTDDASMPTQTNAPAIRLDKSVTDSADADSIGSLGEVLTYSFVVTNTGNVPLTNVTITDPMFSLSGAACVANLAAGASTNCPLLPTQTHTVTATDVTNGSVDNYATTAGTPPTGPDVYDADDASMPTQPQNAQPDLSIDKAVDVSQAVPGQTVTYTIKVRNTGAGPAHDVVVTDPLPSGTSFVSATAPCANSAGTVTCSLGSVAAGATVTLTIKVKVDPATGPTSTHQHAFDYTKVETHLSVFDSDTTGTVQCPSGYVATDGGVRLDSVDQGGSFEDVHVLASAVTPDGKGWTATVRNDNGGQAQAKVNVVCMTERTSSGESHSHPVVITGPVGTTQALAPGHNEIDLSCAAGTYPVQPSYVLSGGTASVGTRRTAGGWRFVVEADTATSGTFAIHCLSKTLGTTSGHDHELLFQELSDTVSVPPGSVVERKLTCPDGYKGIVAWADLDPGLVSLGNDPQPITRVFKFYNPTGSALDADFGLLCVSIRTKGGNAGDTDVTNTASLTSSSSDPTPGDHTDSATFTVNPTGVIVAPRAVVVTKAGRTQVRLSVTATGKRSVTMKLVAAGKVGGTRIRAGSVLAQRRATLGKGKATVALTARGSAGQVLRAGRVDRAKLVVISHGHKSVRVIRLHR